ncbi:MAG: hypothetical protein Q9207_003214 [Kuettlingeria erythrocarpa]
MIYGPDEQGHGRVRSDERVTACGNGTFCCGMGAAANSCCSQGKGVRIINGLTTLADSLRATTSRSVPPSTSSPLPLTKSTTTPPRIPSQALYPSSTASFMPSSPSLSSSPSPRPFGVGPLVSVILGGVFLAFLLTSAGVYIYRRRRRRRQLYAKQDSSLGGSIVILDVDGPTPHYRGSAPSEPEMQGSSIREYGGRQEIDGRVRPPELGGTAWIELPAGLTEKVYWVDRRRNAVMHMGF